MGGAIGTEGGCSSIRIRDSCISNVDLGKERIERGVFDRGGQTERGYIEADTARSAGVALARITKSEFTDQVGTKSVRIAQCGNPGSRGGIALIAIGAFRGKGDVCIGGRV